jgi:hypothetical protein
VGIAGDRALNHAFWRAGMDDPHLWTTFGGALMARRRADDLKMFCGEAARQMVNLETRLRTLVAANRREPEMTLIEEAVGPSLQLAKALLDAGRQGRHETLLALRPLLRALALGTR